MTPIFIYHLLIGGINVSDFHIVVFFSVLLYTNHSFFDERDTEQIQIQMCGNSTENSTFPQLCLLAVKRGTTRNNKNGPRGLKNVGGAVKCWV